MSGFAIGRGKDMSKKVFAHILVPYNGTPGSQKAFKKAVALAQLAKSKITIITCLEECSTLGLFKTKVNKQDFEKECELVIQEHVKLEKYATEFGVSSSFKIVKSNRASHAILEFVDKHDVDLIIMGKTKLVTRYEKIHYQTTVEAVFRNAKCPLLII